MTRQDLLEEPEFGNLKSQRFSTKLKILYVLIVNPRSESMHVPPNLSL